MCPFNAILNKELVLTESIAAAIVLVGSWRTSSLGRASEKAVHGILTAREIFVSLTEQQQQQQKHNAIIIKIMLKVKFDPIRTSYTYNMSGVRSISIPL